MTNRKTCDIILKHCKCGLQIRLVGQAVKTSASHAENMGSIPVRVTKTKGHPLRVSFLFCRPVRSSNTARISFRFHLALKCEFMLLQPFCICPRALWVRICRSKIGKLACQAQSEQIFAKGEIPVSFGSSFTPPKRVVFFRSGDSYEEPPPAHMKL